MANPTQHDRYERLLDFLGDNFHRNITPEDIEANCFYSYRNVNRIFSALRNETIGQHLVRLKLEKAAEYLKYSQLTMVDIAQGLGYVDSASFSKAFKKRYGTSPTLFRQQHELVQDMSYSSLEGRSASGYTPLPFSVELIPDLRVLYCQYTGSYSNVQGMLATWDRLVERATADNLLNDNTIYLGEILDDDEISEDIYCRYNAAITLPEGTEFTNSGAFKVKTIEGGHYARFVHQGSHESSSDTYDRIYAEWMQHVQLELADKASLEFYLNDEADTPVDELLTEICIAVETPDAADHTP